jgi:hypothetical protein
VDFDLDSTEVDVQEFSMTKIDSVRLDFKQYENAVQSMKAKAISHIVTDDMSNVLAVEMAGQAAAMAKQIEKKRKNIVAEPNEFVKSVNMFAKPYTSALEEIGRTLNQKITIYAQEQNRKRLEAQKKAQEEADKLQAEIDKAAAAAGELPTMIVAPVIADIPAVTRTASGSASLRTTWSFVVTDFSLVPDKYKEINRPAINAEIRAGIREIPGVRIYEESKVQIRSASIPSRDDLTQF